MYLGFLPAAELSSLAEAPAFDEDDDNSTIAALASAGTKIRKWQRPIAEDRVASIAKTFRLADLDEDAQATELMANPILLALRENVGVSAVSNGEPFFEVTIDTDASKTPFWILDGQHRIRGMATSEQSSNPLPFVLLFNDDEDGPYDSQLYAKLFAQITTKAEPIHPVHSEWLSHAFRLNAYDPRKGVAEEQRRKAMTTTINLCNEGQKGFHTHNRIVFNPALESSPRPFAWRNFEWVDMLAANYFRIASNSQRSPKQVAEKVRKGLSAMERQIRDPQNSVLFGPTDSASSPGRKKFQEGVVAAILRFLAEKDSAFNVQWPELLQDAKLNCDGWDLGGVGGTAAAASATIVEQVFLAALRGKMPANLTIPRWLQCRGGNSVSILAFPTGPGGGQLHDADPERFSVTLLRHDEDDDEFPADLEEEATIDLAGIEGNPRLDFRVSENLRRLQLLPSNGNPVTDWVPAGKMSLSDLEGDPPVLYFSALGYADVQVLGKASFSP